MVPRAGPLPHAASPPLRRHQRVHLNVLVASLRLLHAHLCVNRAAPPRSMPAGQTRQEHCDTSDTLTVVAAIVEPRLHDVGSQEVTGLHKASDHGVCKHGVSRCRDHVAVAVHHTPSQPHTDLLGVRLALVCAHSCSQLLLSFSQRDDVSLEDLRQRQAAAARGCYRRHRPRRAAAHEQLVTNDKTRSHSLH